jgi:hypothetical protein
MIAQGHLGIDVSCSATRVQLSVSAWMKYSCSMDDDLEAKRPPRRRPNEIWTIPEGRTSRRDGVRAAVAAIATYVVLAVVVYWHVWSTNPTSVSQLDGEQFNTLWFLKWAVYAVRHDHNPFFSNFANYPFGINLLNNSSSLFLGGLFSPVTVIWGPVAAFNTLSTLALAGSGTAGYFFIGRFTRWRLAAFIGGLVYGFGPYEIAQSAGHTNLTFVVFPPLILLVVHEIVVRQRGDAGVWGIVLALLLTAQFFVATEVFASTLVIAAVGVIATCVIGRGQIRARRRYAVTGAVWAAGASVLLLAYPVWFALRGPGAIKGPVQLVPEAYRADLLGLVVPDAHQRFAPARALHVATHFANSPTENGSYLGITLIVVLVIGTVALWRRSTVVRVAAICAVVAFVISLGASLVVKNQPSALPSGFPLPERIFTKLPLLSNTIPVRYSLYVALFAALLFGVVLDALHDGFGASSTGRHTARSQRRTLAAVGWMVPGVIAVVALLPLVPNVPFIAVGQVGTPLYFSTTVDRIRAGTTAIVYPYPSSLTPNAQMWQAVADMRFRMPGGYFLVPQPPSDHIAFSSAIGYGRLTLTATVLTELYRGSPPALTPSLRTKLLGQWQAWRVRTLVAFPEGVPQPGQAVSFFASLLGGPPRLEPGGAYVWDRVPSRKK